MFSNELMATIVRLYAVEKWSVGRIAEHLLIHHSVVERALRQSAGKTKKVRRHRASKLDDYAPFLVETLKKYPSLCASTLHGMARERGMRCSPSHFRALVAQLRPKRRPEAFLRLRTLPGEQGQVDWAHFGELTIGRAVRKLYAFVMVLAFSRRIFLRFGLDIGMTGFLDGHNQAFETFGGVPRVLLYDNLRGSVKIRFLLIPFLLAGSQVRAFQATHRSDWFLKRQKLDRIRYLYASPEIGGDPAHRRCDSIQ